MDQLTDLYFNNPFWIWLAIGAVFLAGEVATGSGLLLWPAACAALVAVLTFVLPGNALVHLAVWAGLTIVATLTARRYLPRKVAAPAGPDINDNVGRLVGHHGVAVEAFANGRGRVFIDGKEWAAVSKDEAILVDQAVKVTAAEGAVLTVKAG